MSRGFDGFEIMGAVIISVLLTQGTGSEKGAQGPKQDVKHAQRGGGDCKCLPLFPSSTNTPHYYLIDIHAGLCVQLE